MRLIARCASCRPAFQRLSRLRAGTPRIEVLTNTNPSLLPVVHEGDPNSARRSRPNSLRIISMTLEPGEDLVVGKRLRDILLEAKSTASKRTWSA